eukprot:6114159-Pleurochrysis_carterae.AAC.3
MSSTNFDGAQCTALELRLSAALAFVDFAQAGGVDLILLWGGLSGRNSQSDIHRLQLSMMPTCVAV